MGKLLAFGLLIIATFVAFLGCMTVFWPAFHKSEYAIAAECLLTFVIGLEGVCAFFHFWHDVETPKQRLTLDFYEKLNSPDWKIISGEVWLLRDRWIKGLITTDQILWFFLNKPVEDAEKSNFNDQLCRNNLTIHQNLSAMLHCWAEISLCKRKMLLDRDLFEGLLLHQLEWYEDYFRELINAYKNTGTESKYSKDPLWVKELPYLLSLLHPKTAPSSPLLEGR